MATNIFSEILQWAKQLSPWQNEALRRLFAKSELSATDRDDLFGLAQIEHRLLPAPETREDLSLKATDLPSPPTPGQQIKLVAVRTPTNVNALRADQRLVVGSNLTIIYGENGAGKSGYARIMKKAFRARVVDSILPNVYSASANKSPASAVFEIEENTTVRDERWTDGIDSPECLGRFAVFDSKCARVYVSDHNVLNFLPYGFDLIDGLAKITAEIKQRFLNLATSSAPRADGLKHLIDDSPTGKCLGSITAGTLEAEIVLRAVWKETDLLALTTKEAELARLKASSPQVLRDNLAGRKRQIGSIRTALTNMADAISDAKVLEIQGKVGELKKYDVAVEAAAKAAFGDLELPGIGTDVWRELLSAAARFSTTIAYKGQEFPPGEAETKCVLCLRTLDDEARNRLDRFWKFIEDDVSSKRDESKKFVKAAQEILQKLSRSLPKEIQMLEESLRAAGSQVFEPTKTFFAGAGGRVSAIESAMRTHIWEGIPAVPPSPVDICDTELHAIDKALAEIVNDQQVSTSIATLTSEVAELKAKKRLTDNLSDVLSHLKALKQSAAAMAAAGKITTNAISNKAAELQTKFVTEAFKKRVQAELKPIGMERVRTSIDKKSDKGKVLHKLSVDGVTSASPESVFSEGERTAISLACFLAELSASDDNCGIIFDDPVSSLDHRVREAIVTRLVTEAGNRQVIIFTHDLVFYRELAAAAERQKVPSSFQNVEALGDTTGILTDVPPWPALKIKERIPRLEKVLKAAKDAESQANPPAYRAAFREFYDLLRSTWERSVEELLFNQVVQRLEKEVKTMSLDAVCVDSESVASVFGGMTRTSSMIEAHDHAVAVNSSLPAYGQMAEDLQSFKSFVENQKAKSTAAKRQNEHLKK